MNTYKRQSFPPDVIRYAVCLFFSGVGIGVLTDCMSDTVGLIKSNDSTMG